MGDFETLCRRLYDEEVLRLRTQIAEARRSYHHERVAMLADALAVYRSKFPQYAHEPA
jgi:hypothetical protein